MHRFFRNARIIAVLCLVSLLSGCDNTHVYGSVGVSTGFGSYHGSGNRMHGSISVGGRIR